METLPTFDIQWWLEQYAVPQMETGTLAYCSAIAVVATYGALRLFMKISRVRRSLRNASKLFVGVDSPGAFRREIEALHVQLGNDPIVGHQWTEYRETLVVPRDPLAPIHNTIPPEEFFNAGAILHGVLNLRLYRQLPNWLTGAGILGTFLGLTLGLTAVGDRLASSDTNEIRAALTGLLHGAQLAFWTSVTGLLCSILFASFENRLLHRVESDLQRWCGTLERLLARVTSQSLALDTLHESEQQTEQLKRFNTDLAVSIANALDDRLAERISPLLRAMIDNMAQTVAPKLDTMVAGIQGIREDRSHSNDVLLREMVSEFKESLTGAAGQEIQAIATTLSQLTDQLQQTATKLSGAGAEAGQGLLEASRSASREMHDLILAMTERFDMNQRRMEESVGALTGSVEASVQALGGQLEASMAGAGAGLKEAARGAGALVTEAAGSFRSAVTDSAATMASQVERFESATLVLEQAVKQASQLGDRTQNAFREMANTAELVRAAGKELREAMVPLELAATELKRTTEAQTAAARMLADTAAELGKTGGGVRDTAAQLEKSWTAVNARFESVDRALAQTFSELVTATDNYQGRIREFVVELEKHLDGSVKLLSGAIEDFGGSIEDLSEVMGRRDGHGSA